MNILEQVKTRIRQGLESALAKSGLAAPEEYPDITLEVPKEKQHGDFSTNLAMQLTRIAKQNPRVIAEKLLDNLNTEESGIVKAEIAGPGFINLFTDKTYLYDVIEAIATEGKRFGSTNLGQNEKIQIEFVSANPTGNLHLGHARGAAFGDSLCNVLDFAGYDVSREYYINDAGNQVDNLTRSLEARYRQALGQTGEQAEIPEDGYHGEDIRVFGQQLAEREGDRLLDLPEDERSQYFRTFGLEQELNKIKRDLERFRVSFDVWFSESSLYEGTQIKDVLQRLKDDGESYEMDGATWLKTTSYGDDKDRVLIKQDGSFTYLTPDIAYHKNKYSRGFDRLINIWGADHHGYIPRMKAAMTALGEDASKLTVLIAQMVNLFQDGQKVKMSKRTGKAVTMEELMDEVGVDAIRYFFTMRSIDSHLDFDLDLALSQSNENPVYYVQYAHARICSIFRQAKEKDIQLQALSDVNLKVLNAENDFELLKKLAAFPEEVEMAAAQYAPHRVIRYVYELSSLFHSYYRAERVITEDAETTQARFALLAAVRQVLQNALRIIGVSAPEEM